MARRYPEASRLGKRSGGTQVLDLSRRDGARARRRSRARGPPRRRRPRRVPVTTPPSVPVARTARPIVADRAPPSTPGRDRPTRPADRRRCGGTLAGSRRAAAPGRRRRSPPRPRSRAAPRFTPTPSTTVPELRRPPPPTPRGSRHLALAEQQVVRPLAPHVDAGEGGGRLGHRGAGEEGQQPGAVRRQVGAQHDRGEERAAGDVGPPAPEPAAARRLVPGRHQGPLRCTASSPDRAPSRSWSR